MIVFIEVFNVLGVKHTFERFFFPTLTQNILHLW